MTLDGPLFYHERSDHTLRRRMYGNALLIVLTLGLYVFWAHANVWRYLCRQTSFAGDPLTFTGTGSQLLFRTIANVILYVGPLAVAGYLIWTITTPENPYSYYYFLLLLLPLVFIRAVARYRARAYRLRHSKWRGIAANQTGSPIRFATRTLLHHIVSFLSLGWYHPLTNMIVMQYMVDNTHFGNAKFSYRVSTMTLYKPFALAWMRLLSLGLLIAILYFAASAMAQQASEEAAIPEDVLIIIAQDGGRQFDRSVYGLIYRDDGDQLFFTDRATPGEAKILDELLREIGSFRGAGATAQLDRTAAKYIIRYVLEPGRENNPKYIVRVQKFLWEASQRYDGAPVEFHVSNSDLSTRHVVPMPDQAPVEEKTGLLAAFLPLIGAAILFVLFVPLNFAWYRAAYYRQIARCSNYENVRFEFTATGGDLFRLSLGNILIMLFTLGFGWPWVVRRKFSFFADKVVAVGDFNPNEIAQTVHRTSRPDDGYTGSLEPAKV